MLIDLLLSFTNSKRDRLWFKLKSELCSALLVYLPPKLIWSRAHWVRIPLRSSLKGQQSCPASIRRCNQHQLNTKSHWKLVPFWWKSMKESNPDEDKLQTDLYFGEGDGDRPEGGRSWHVSPTGDMAGKAALIGGRWGGESDSREENPKRIAEAVSALEVEGTHRSDWSNRSQLDAEREL